MTRMASPEKNITAAENNSFPGGPGDADAAQEAFTPEEAQAELERLREDTHTYLRARTVGWLVRWGIGFTGLAVLVWYQPELAWLWRWAIAIALVSLIILVLARAALIRRMRDAEAAIMSDRQNQPSETDPGETDPGETDPGQTYPEQTYPEQTEPGQTKLSGNGLSEGSGDKP
ncbi:MAG: hypothetical protein AAFQ42_14430 [Pseudomonadota bacterium]